MKLYRTFSTESATNSSVFHDATSSLDDAVAYATQLEQLKTNIDVWIEEEDWPSLSRWKYLWHRSTGTHEGFGVNFKNKCHHRIDGSKIVWPKLAVLKESAEIFLKTVQPCSDFVLVASPKYSGKYRCEVVVRRTNLLPHAIQVRDSTFGGDVNDEVARIAFPIWLDRIDTTVTSPTPLIPQFFDLVDQYVPNFISKHQASVFCLDCKQTVTQVRTEVRNEEASGEHGEWTSSWRCPVGHNLYSEDHKTRLILRPK